MSEKKKKKKKTDTKVEWLVPITPRIVSQDGITVVMD